MGASVCRRAVVTCCLFVLSALPVKGATEEANISRSPIERFHQVDERLYRGAQPDAAGFKYLHDLGIRTIINLRLEADAARLDEQRVVESLGMHYVNLPIEDGNMFTRSRRVPEETIKKFFNVIDNAAAGPFFVHCHRGADRTGALVSFYRIARQGWDGLRAYTEARSIGMRSWYTGFKQQIQEFSQHAAQYAAVH